MLLREEFFKTTINFAREAEQRFYPVDYEKGIGITRVLAEAREFYRANQLEKGIEYFSSKKNPKLRSRADFSLGMTYLLFTSTLNHPDPIQETVRAGGDTDSNAAMVGTLVGALYGEFKTNPRANKFENFSNTHAKASEFAKFLLKHRNH